MSSFISDDSIKANMGYGLLFKKLWPYLKRHLFMLVAAIALVIAMAVVSRLLPTLIGQAIDVGVKNKDYEALKRIAYWYLCFVILNMLFQLSYQWVFQTLGNRVLYYLREDLIQHVQRLPMQYFNKTPVGRIVTRLTNDVSNLADLFTDGVITIFTELVMMLGILIAMLLISVKLTVVTLLTAPIFIFLAIFISDKLREVYRDAKKKLSQLNSFVAENFSGIKVIQLYNRVPRNRRHFGDLSSDYKDLTLQSIRYFALMQPVMNFFTAFTVTAALAYGGYLSVDDALAIGSLVAFILHAQDFIPPLREILEKYQQFQNSLTSAERVFQLFDEIEEYDLDNVEGSLVSSKDLKGHLQIKDLNFKYEKHLPVVLNDINLEIQPGQSVALVGRTGSGKTTLSSLLLRFYDAPQKTIFLDGQPLESFAKLSLRQKMGSVLQDNFIFRGTIRDNISLNDKTITEDRIVQACRQTGYLDLLLRTGRSLETWVEERGANLSVGERQLIAFARILAFQPDVLILDEATANIDSQSEKLIQKATRMVTQGRTSIIIAHRLSTIEDCDQIFVFDQGRIIEAGNHRELMSKQGVYYQLATAAHHTSQVETPDFT